MFKNYPVIKSLTAFILPYIALYSIYIQINGEVSPGGGFQAGVIFASSIIGFDLINSDKEVFNLLSVNSLIRIATIGVLIYACTGLISLLFGDNYLNYYSLLQNRLLAQSLGIFLIEIGVGLTISSVMILIYFLFQD